MRHANKTELQRLQTLKLEYEHANAQLAVIKTRFDLIVAQIKTECEVDPEFTSLNLDTGEWSTAPKSTP